ncbi:OLC1v1022626C1 [Oldenlandia corymbosa var. corymbosa]|uniref:OLC1v1022626C1 n=1 Tax=Oldenlandia corymbosa var. corymbosa TaxID=529605 RepID=A0AAV1BZN8_OLDCO|nr:OLC1v1022626C1 [Oldenlandia corymbosa var. corymbosa]
MGTNQRSHGKSNLRSSSKKGSEVSLGGSILGFVTQGCLGTRNIKRRNSRTLHSQDITKHHERLNHSHNKGLKPPSTLQEWIIQSPGIHHGSFEGDPLILQVSKPVSKRVHPSLGRSVRNRQSKPQEGRKLKRNPAKLSDARSGENGDSFTFSRSVTTSKSGKLRKKVSFKEPEVADVFILKNSPE